jgi:hypothetical protein
MEATAELLGAWPGGPGGFASAMGGSTGSTATGISSGPPQAAVTASTPENPKTLRWKGI